ncbi:hypothetical protein C0J52_17554 [Blattella germanica]|nr:hypothetical protein C0J52_17554 [Blattella germanica]
MGALQVTLQAAREFGVAILYKECYRTIWRSSLAYLHREDCSMIYGENGLMDTAVSTTSLAANICEQMG